jgi:uncharacterized membrane protein
LNGNITQLIEAISVVVAKSQASESIAFAEWINVAVAIFSVLGTVADAAHPASSDEQSVTTREGSGANIKDNIHKATRELLELAAPQPMSQSRAVGKLGCDLPLVKLLEIITQLLPLLNQIHKL